MTVASFVLVCALDLLGRSADQFPPIIIVDRPADVSRDAVAFVRRGESAIYMIGTSPIFKAAVEDNAARQGCRNLDLLRLIASTIVHEEWHLRHGPDERGAYHAQMIEILRLGSQPGRWPYETVRRALETTLKREAALTRVSRQDAAPASAAATSPKDPAVAGAATSRERPWLGAALHSLSIPIVR